MLKPIFNSKDRRMRVVGYVSGSGETLFRSYELQKKLEESNKHCPFEIVGVFSSKKEAKALEKAEKLGITAMCLDLRDYAKTHQESINSMELREKYDKEVLELIRPLNPDLIMLAGYVWAVTDLVLNSYTVMGVHPGDLSVQTNGHRLYAGADGVGLGLEAKEEQLHSASYLATGEMDGGPILFISEGVPVDYNLHSEYQDRWRHYLRLVNEQSRQVGAHTLLELASGKLARDEQGRVYYMEEMIPLGMRLE